jgi:hypothetical protein
MKENFKLKVEKMLNIQLQGYQDRETKSLKRFKTKFSEDPPGSVLEYYQVRRQRGRCGRSFDKDGISILHILFLELENFRL